MTQHNPAAKLYCGATVNVSEQIKVAWCHSGQLSTQGVDRLQTNRLPFFKFGLAYVFKQASGTHQIRSYEGGTWHDWGFIGCGEDHTVSPETDIHDIQNWLISVCATSYLQWVKAGNNSPIFHLAALGWMCKLAFFIAAWTVSSLKLSADFQGQPFGVSDCRNVQRHLRKAAIVKGFFLFCSDSCLGRYHNVKL